ncbi:hypothetical protein B0T26DRAFT_522158 [Lasiosphaeria miniovina]|uniref:Ribosomal protein S6 n=1 Tax=Lasiosphaeria miniovina TaxID=1954250 RepID=A0AA40DLB8_9PEZI|nr:uncharacterized protein B0T26DRAFT_522158 [Lasiosphaeria miniovina]KAK0704058.1 hypothetical protein B0T26DRAFT_522158 [Lasiosphaeria miniovina]
MLYEVIGMVRQGNLNEVKELVLIAGKTVLQQGGVIRDIKNWGTFMLPSSASLNQVRHTRAHYFLMRYDASTKTHREVYRELARDPRVIRATGVTLGNNKLETLSKFGPMNWRRMD